MTDKKITILISIFLLTNGFAGTSGSLQLDLPSEIFIDSDNIVLDHICMLQGDPNLIAIAAGIPLGKISVLDQTLVIDRKTLLGRLVSNGISKTKIKFRGAHQITVGRKHTEVTGNKIIEAARIFIEGQKLSGGAFCTQNPVRTPANVLVAGERNNIEVTALQYRTSGNTLTVDVAIRSDSKQIDSREVAFRMQYNCRKVVAAADIPAGNVISQDVVRVEKYVSDKPGPADWKIPYGLIARRAMSANSIISSEMLTRATPAILVEQNKNVVIRIERSGLYVSAIGKALQKGFAGDLIKVENIESKKIILAKVNNDGSVEPVF